MHKHYNIESVIIVIIIMLSINTNTCIVEFVYKQVV